MLLAGVHDHGAPSLAGMYDRNPSPQSVAYTRKVEDAAVEAVRRARTNLQPARFGFGIGKTYVNINRRAFFPEKGWWWIGYNPDGPSDKTVAVLKFTDLSGKAIALFINYAVHGVVMLGDNLAITGDLPGSTSRFVERFYRAEVPISEEAKHQGLELRPEETVSGESPVVVWTSGAAGDQNPITLDRGGILAWSMAWVGFWEKSPCAWPTKSTSCPRNLRLVAPNK
jgi:hypothetical protein